MWNINPLSKEEEKEFLSLDQENRKIFYYDDSAAIPPFNISSLR